MFYGGEAIHREQTKVALIVQSAFYYHYTCILILDLDHHFLWKKRDSILKIGQQADMERMSLQQKYAETGPSDV